MKVLKGISFSDLHGAYREYCKNETAAAPVDLGEVIPYYNQALADLPDHASSKGIKLPGTERWCSTARASAFAEVAQPDHRRIWVPLSDIPEPVQKAFVAAEDKRFYQHKGIDERGIIRAFIGNLAKPGRPQGGSTITQQVVKNLLVGDDVTYERKMREMVLAARLERTLSKPEILEIYLNSIYLGRSAWGVEMAARSYFGESVTALTRAEGALLAGLTKGPNYYNPDRSPSGRASATPTCSTGCGRTARRTRAGAGEALALCRARSPRAPAAGPRLLRRRPHRPGREDARRHRRPDRPHTRSARRSTRLADAPRRRCRRDWRATS